MRCQKEIAVSHVQLRKCGRPAKFRIITHMGEEWLLCATHANLYRTPWRKAILKPLEEEPK